MKPSTNRIERIEEEKNSQENGNVKTRFRINKLDNVGSKNASRTRPFAHWICHLTWIENQKKKIVAKLFIDDIVQGLGPIPSGKQCNPLLVYGWNIKFWWWIWTKHFQHDGANVHRHVTMLKTICVSFFFFGKTKYHFEFKPIENNLDVGL